MKKLKKTAFKRKITVLIDYFILDFAYRLRIIGYAGMVLEN